MDALKQCQKLGLSRDAVELYHTSDAAEAQLVCDHLGHHGVRAAMLGGNVDRSLGWPLGFGEAARVYVDENDVVRARQLVIALDKSLCRNVARPLQFSLRTITVFQLIVAVLLTVYTVVRPDFLQAYAFFSLVFYGWLFLACCYNLFVRRRES